VTIALLSVASIFLGVIYSCKPSFLSGRPFADFIANALGFGVIAFGAGWGLAGRAFSTPVFFIAALPYFLLMCAGSISSTVPDMIGDRETGKKTTAVYLGEKPAHYLATLFIVLAAAASIIDKDAIAGTCALAALPIYLLQIFFPCKLFVESTYKAGGALCMLAAVCIMPVFLFAGLIVFLATWIYFRVRHKASYPSLVPLERAG
jgi:4-hydroxybenzoate polyprenyltransferase